MIVAFRVPGVYSRDIDEFIAVKTIGLRMHSIHIMFQLQENCFLEERATII